MSERGVYGKEGGVMPQGIDVVEQVKREYCRAEARRMADEMPRSKQEIQKFMIDDKGESIIFTQEKWIAQRLYEVLSHYEQHLERMVKEYAAGMHEMLGQKAATDIVAFRAVMKEKK
jgi:hypothetical protein